MIYEQSFSEMVDALYSSSKEDMQYQGESARFQMNGETFCVSTHNVYHEELTKLWGKGRIW